MIDHENRSPWQMISPSNKDQALLDIASKIPEPLIFKELKLYI
jgi:hypothetical protein